MYDYRIYTPLPDFKITDEIITCAILSDLAYLDIDVFLLKWNQCKNSNVIESKEETINYYIERDYYINKIFNKITETPIIYNGLLNPNIYKDTQAFFIKMNDIQYITFRGTENIFDLFADLNITKVQFEDFKNVMVHRGFYMQFLSIKNEIIKDIALNKQIILTGHSLGGAVATLTAVYIANLYPEVDITLITYACPKIGTQAFAELFKKTILKNFRFVTEEDVIPIIAATFDYVQVSDAYCIKEKQVLKQENDVHWMLALYHALFKSLFYMHSCNTYISTLFSLLKSNTIDI